MDTANNRYIDELMSNALEDNVPPDVDRQLRSQLESFRSRLGEMEKPTVHRSMALGRRAWFGVSAAAAAATIAAVLVWWSLLPGVSLADVAAAVLKQPWIHVSETDPRGKANEFWYSPVKDISAWHDSEWIEYRDHRLRVYYAYDLHDKVLYRVPEEMRRGMEYFASMIASLRILLESRQPVDNPLERLGFLGNEQTRPKILKQEVKKVKEDGREWLDYHLTMTVQEPRQPDVVQEEMIFRVDPDTKLLRLSRYESHWKRQHIVTEDRFDYPEKGPADVYDLGVPKTAKLVDRVPTNELGRILETIRAGRQRMDDYRAALVTQHPIPGMRDHLPFSLEIICRKGDKFRRDSAVLKNPNDAGDPKLKWPKKGDWWNKCVKDRYWFIPMSIDRDSTQYTTRWKSVTDPDGSHHTEITEVEKREHGGIPGEIYPGLWSQMPEFACRPPLGIPHETLEAVLEPNPKEGPAGTILLRVRSVGPKLPREKRSDGKLLLPLPDGWRFWLDPKRDYAVVRDDMLGDFDDAGKEKVISTVIDEMARSPQGTWYATRIRRKGASKSLKDGKTFDQIIDIYVDFNADLPDSLFKPPTPGRIH